MTVVEFAMDVSSIASLATSMSETANNQAVGIAVLKKAMSIESAGALALVNAIPSAASLPANLGQNINIAV
jgi:putative motility protein YjfB-like